MVVPVENNLLYVEPIYITSGVDGSSLPQIARIVMTYNDVVVSETTIDKCLEKLFGYTVSSGETEEQTQPLSLNNYLNNLIESYNNAKKHSGDGDWEAFGRSMDELDYYINNIENILNNEQE